MQPEHHGHKTLVEGVVAEQLARAGIIGIKGRDVATADSFPHAHIPGIWLVGIGDEKLHGVTGAARLGVGDDGVDIGAPCSAG